MEIPEKTCEYCTHFRFAFRPNRGALPVPVSHGVCYTPRAPRLKWANALACKWWEPREGDEVYGMTRTKGEDFVLGEETERLLHQE